MFLSVDRVTGDGLVSKSCLCTPRSSDWRCSTGSRSCLLCFKWVHEANFHNPFKNQLHSSQAQNQRCTEVLKVNWFSSGLQSAFRKSIGSVRGFRAQVNWFSSGLRARYTLSLTHSLTHTHTHTHHSPLCKSYSQISSFGRKTSRSATDCRETHSFITLHTKHLTSARWSTAFKISETSPKQTFAIIWITVIYSCVCYETCLSGSCQKRCHEERLCV